MLPKDLLVLVFDQIENGHDMINFGELNQKCHQIWKQKIGIYHGTGRNRWIYTYLRSRGSKFMHGLSRMWLAGTFYDPLGSETNYYYDQQHGQDIFWANDGRISSTTHYCHGKLHGLQFYWIGGKYLDNHFQLSVRDKLSVRIYHHGNKLSKRYRQVYTNPDNTFKSAYDSYHDVWYHAVDVEKSYNVSFLTKIWSWFKK